MSCKECSSISYVKNGVKRNKQNYKCKMQIQLLNATF